MNSTTDMRIILGRREIILGLREIIFGRREITFGRMKIILRRRVGRCGPSARTSEFCREICYRRQTMAPRSTGRDTEVPRQERNCAVDLSLIDEMLRLSPTERLDLNDRLATMAEELRAGVPPRRDDD